MKKQARKGSVSSTECGGRAMVPPQSCFLTLVYSLFSSFEMSEYLYLSRSQISLHRLWKVEEIK